MVISAVKSSNDTTVVIPNLCSLDSKYHTKFASLLYNKFPIIQTNLEVSTGHKLGSNHYCDLYQNNSNKNKIICSSMICNADRKSNGRYINYGALAVCMINLNSYCKQYLEKYPDQRIEIHSAKFGTGSAGGDWKTISNLIDDIWCKDYTVYIYEPNYV